MAVEVDDLNPFFPDDGYEPADKIFANTELTEYLDSPVITTEDLASVRLPDLEVVEAFEEFMGRQSTVKKTARWRHNLNITSLIHQDNVLGQPMNAEHITRVTDDTHESLLRDWEEFIGVKSFIWALPDPIARREVKGFESMDEVEAGMYKLVREVLEHQNAQADQPAPFITDEMIMEVMVDQSKLTKTTRAWFQLHPPLVVVPEAPPKPAGRSRRLYTKIAAALLIQSDKLIYRVDKEGNLVDEDGNPIEVDIKGFVIKEEVELTPEEIKAKEVEAEFWGEA